MNRLSNAAENSQCENFILAAHKSAGLDNQVGSQTMVAKHKLEMAGQGEFNFKSLYLRE